MKTDDLISMLAVNNEAVHATAMPKRLPWALLGGLVGGLVLMVLAFGLRKDFAQAVWLPMFWFKLVFAFALALPAWILTLRLGHPGLPLGHLGRALVVPWFVLTALALVVWVQTPAPTRTALVLGTTWASCAFNISLVSLPSFVGLFWTLRGLAPTRLALAGACAGLGSASLGTFIYALHCPEMEAPFLAVWYVLGLAIPTALGALLGPKLLRW
jgi:hypothetical protein